MNSGKEIRAVLFDLDGVLIDSFSAWYSAFNDTMNKFGKEPLEKKEFEEENWGLELEVNMEKIGLGSEGVDFCKSRFINHIDKIEVFPKVEEILGSIDKKIGLVTSTPAGATSKILDHFDLEVFFDVVVTGDDVENPKPAAEPVLRACELLGVAPEVVVFVGDNQSDVRAGKAAGCRVVGVGVESDLEIDEFSELLEVLNL